jgi:pimeloyl-ACP methyl ester carboxylesterase
VPTSNVNGVALYYQLSGQAGPPLAMVHGAWWSHRSWEVVAPGLAKYARLLTYDRRGHSASERPEGPFRIRDDVSDLAELIEQLELAPAWVAGVSSGANVVLRLASERPELLRGAIVHEPALFSLLADDPEAAAMLDIVRARIGAVAERIRSGDHEGAAKQFVETVGGTPGRWDQLSPDYQRIIVSNAPAFLQGVQDPEAGAFDLEWLVGFSKPLLLTHGDQSPPFYAQVVRRIAPAVPQAKVLTFEGAAHVPQRTHPHAYVEAVTSFIAEHAGSA